MRKDRKPFIALATGCVLVSLATGIILIYNPFHDFSMPFHHSTEAVSEANIDDSEIETINISDSSTTDVNDYGMKVNTETATKIANNYLDTVFNVSYRSVKDVDKYAENIEKVASKVTFSDFKGETYSYLTLADYLAETYKKNEIQLKAKFTPEYGYKTDLEDDIQDITLNGNLEVTFVSGKDFTKVADLLGIKNPKIGETYNIEYHISALKDTSIEDDSWDVYSSAPGYLSKGNNSIINNLSEEEA